MAYHDIVKRILSDAATSFNLRRRIEEDQLRDPVDALNDADVLQEVANMRMQEVLGLTKPEQPKLMNGIGTGPAFS